LPVRVTGTGRGVSALMGADYDDIGPTLNAATALGG